MKRSLKFMLLAMYVFVIVSAVSAAALQIPDNLPSWRHMDPEKLAGMLKTGELIAVDRVGNGAVEMVTIGMLADAPPEKVWKVITDFKGYEALLPNQLKIEVLGKSGDTQNVKFSVSVLKVAIIDIKTEYTLKYTLDKPKTAKIDWVEGDVKNVAGFWELHPVAGGKKTVAIYGITSDLASANKFVEKALSEQPATVMAINLSSAIIFTKRLMEVAEGRPRSAAPAGSGLTWKTLDKGTLTKLLGGGRTGFISRVGNKEIAVAAVLAKQPPEKVWKNLTDFDGYPKRIKQVTKSEVLKKTDDMARVKMRTEIISLGGPIKIGTEGVTKYFFDKKSKMWSEDDEKPRKDVFNRWELVPLDGGKSTGVVNESVSDISSMGTIANMMLKMLPALQISVDLSQGMIMVDEMRKWSEGK